MQGRHDYDCPSPPHHHPRPTFQVLFLAPAVPPIPGRHPGDTRDLRPVFGAEVTAHRLRRDDHLDGAGGLGCAHLELHRQRAVLQRGVWGVWGGGM